MNDVNFDDTLVDNDTFLESVDLNSYLKKIYDLIGNDELQDEFKNQTKLSRLRNENHKRYYNIDLNKYKGLPDDMKDVVDDILKYYQYILPSELLNCNFTDAENTKILLDNIYNRISRLDRMVSSYLKNITNENDERQSKFSFTFFKNLDLNYSVKKILLEKYNDLILYNSYITEDAYEDLKRQMKRQSYINEILKFLNIEEKKKQSIGKEEKLSFLNKQINEEIEKYRLKIQYLEDIMLNNSKYVVEFNNFKDFCNKLFAYDDTDFENTKQTFEILSDELRFSSYFSNFETLFIEEIHNKEKEKKFIYEKVGIKNLKTSLNYIINNYDNQLDDESANIINYIYTKINTNDYDLKELSNSLKLIVRNIWNATITNIYEYNPNKEYYFICSNNQFIDEKYQTILITKNEINKVTDYNDYQIGFICGYNDNILYITENDDIMTVDNDDMSNLKTPIQLEQEFVNFKICNRIAMDGYRTKIEAVYFINDGNRDKYMKALELANMHKLPLIELKKD